MNYENNKPIIRIEKANNGWVSLYVNDIGYLGYSKRDALKDYRERYGLKGKHCIVYDYTK